MAATGATPAAVLGEITIHMNTIMSSESPQSEELTPLQAALLKIVAKYDKVTFAELPRRLADLGFPVDRGDEEIILPGNVNVVIWVGISRSLCDAVLGLLETGRLHLHPASELDYITEGPCLDLPIVRRSGITYKRPHWLPVCLRSVPLA